MLNETETKNLKKKPENCKINKKKYIWKKKMGKFVII